MICVLNDDNKIINILNVDITTADNERQYYPWNRLWEQYTDVEPFDYAKNRYINAAGAEFANRRDEVRLIEFAGGTYGFDCSGFTQYAFARAGISIPRMADSQLYYGRQISMSELRPGDLIFFSTYEPGASHCGIYLGDGKFIHAGTSTGVVVADAFTGYWGERYYGACRVL